MPLISIIVPVYKTEKYLRCCVDSILAQTFTDFECILVDDGSPDNCPAICDEYAEKDNRIIVIHQENAGSSAARNTGLDIARGEYIGFVDSDDWIEKDMFEELYKKADSEEYDIVWCDLYKEYQDNKIYIKNEINDLKNIDIIKKMLSGELSGFSFNKLIKRTLCVNNNIIFPIANQMEDFVFIIQSVYCSKKIGYINKALYHYRQNIDSLSFRRDRLVIRFQESFDNIKILINILQEKYKMDIIDLDPEFSYFINSFKIEMLRIKKVRDYKILFAMYPNSHKFIFHKYFKRNTIIKLSLYLATKKFLLPFEIMDFLFPYKGPVLNKIKK